jgi:hypothetical protein
VDGNKPNAFWIEISLNGVGQGLLLNSNFWRMISYIMFYRNMLSFGGYQNFSSAYTALTDSIGGHFWASKLLRTCIVIKVTIAIFHVS